MAKTTEAPIDFEPHRPALLAWGIFAAAALTLCWPIFTGHFLAGPDSDMYEAGYSFRAFAASYFKTYRAIPQWNPYLMGGVPYVAAGAGDIFYPTAWLRWILPTDFAINLGFFLHIAIAGGATYGLLRSLRVSWAGAVVAGLAYELTGIVAGQVHPGHDGKLFVAALAPLLFLGVVRAVRDRQVAGFATIALSAGLSLQAHPQASYYLLVAGGVWGLFWLFGPEGPVGSARLRIGAGAVGAVALGAGLYAIYLAPFYQYIPFSPRADAGYNSGWEHAISYALPLPELIGVVLPKIYGGVKPDYFGPNGLRLHSEYIGPLAILLAILGLGGPDRRWIRFALGTVAVLFLLVSLGGATPFYRLWYEVMPMMKKVRAAGMAFFLVALPVAVLAGFGAERLFRGTGAVRRALIGGGVLAAFGLLGAVGALQTVAFDIASRPGYAGFIEKAIANSGVLKLDGLRLLILATVGMAAITLVGRGRLKGAAAIAVVAIAVFADLFIEARPLFTFSPGKAVTYADDEITARIRRSPLPYRVWEPAGDRLGGAGAYPRSWLMSREIPSLFGYHGNEISFFDELFGGKNVWPNQLNPALLKLFGVQYLIANQPIELPSFTKILGPVRTAMHDSAYLYQADTVPPYARIYRAAAKVPDAQIAATVADPRFPIERVVLFSDTATVNPAPLENKLPEQDAVAATVVEWRPGRLRIAIESAASEERYLVVSENWYLDWKATVDGQPAPVLRGQNTLLSARLAPGAREVIFEFDSPQYRRGRLISILSALGVLGLFAWPLVARRKPRDG